MPILCEAEDKVSSFVYLNEQHSALFNSVCSAYGLVILHYKKTVAFNIACELFNSGLIIVTFEFYS